jgi:transposase-like protein
MSRAGRKPQGAALVAPLSGSEHAKRRLALFLQTAFGHCTVSEACAELGIGESRFFAQRAAWLQQSLALLEPRSPGRPPKPEPMPDPADVRRLRDQLRQLEARSAAVEVQAELASLLPHVMRRSAGKKTK